MSFLAVIVYSVPFGLITTIYLSVCSGLWNYLFLFQTCLDPKDPLTFLEVLPQTLYQYFGYGLLTLLVGCLTTLYLITALVCLVCPWFAIHSRTRGILGFVVGAFMFLLAGRFAAWGPEAVMNCLFPEVPFQMALQVPVLAYLLWACLTAVWMLLEAALCNLYDGIKDQ